MQAIIDACNSGVLPMTPSVVISNNSSSTALTRARIEGIPGFHLSGRTHPGRGELDQAILSVLTDHQVDLVILAGYMKKLESDTLKQYEGRILNIHPGLLPDYGGRGMYGIHVHQKVIDDGASETGMTIHQVDGQYDHGKVVNMRRVPVCQGENASELQQRILSLEHEFFVETLLLIAKGEIPL